MTTQDLLCTVRGHEGIFTLIHITNKGECFLAKLQSKDFPGELISTTKEFIEPIGFNPLTVRDLKVVPQQEPEVVFIMGPKPIDSSRSGLYTAPKDEEDVVRFAYSKDFGEGPNPWVLGYLDHSGRLRRGPSCEDIELEELQVLIDTLVTQVKQNIKDSPIRP
jgi:hypothetical protein